MVKQTNSEIKVHVIILYTSTSLQVRGENSFSLLHLLKSYSFSFLFIQTNNDFIS